MNCQSIPIRIGHVKTSEEFRGSEAEMKSLVESMREVGQLQEIVLNSRYEVIAGRRRVEAAHRLGLTHLRAFVNPSFDDAIRAIKAERDENCPGCRVPLTRKQQLELARKLEALENPEAAKRKAASQAKKGAGKAGAGKFPEPGKKGDTRDKVGEAVGMSGRTLEKAQAVIDAAQKQPDRYLDLAQKVSADKQPIDPVHQEFKAREEVYAAADSDPRFADIAAKLTETHDTEKAHAAFEKRKEQQSMDAVGQPIPKRLVKVFSNRWAVDAATTIQGIQDSLSELVKVAKKYRNWLDGGSDAEHDIEEADKYLEWARIRFLGSQPFAVCLKCKGSGCKTCGDDGWLNEEDYQLTSHATPPR